MGVEVWQRLGTPRAVQAESPAPKPWYGWLHLANSARALAICELTASTSASPVSNRFDAAEHKLLRNILFAVGISLDQCNLLLVRQGSFNTWNQDAGETAFTAVGGSELTTWLPSLLVEPTLVFGSNFVHSLSCEVKDALPARTCLVPSELREMLEQPERKKECWNIVKALI